MNTYSNPPEPDDETTFWRCAGETPQAQAEAVVVGMMLHKPDVAMPLLSQFKPGDITSPILARIAYLAFGDLNLRGIVRVKTITDYLPLFHFGEHEIGVQLDRLANVGQHVNKARAEKAVRWLVEGRVVTKKGRAAA